MRITIGDVKSTIGITNTYDIVNAIRNSSGDLFKQYVPLANADNVAEVGAGLLINQQVQNEFISALVDRIGLTVIRSTLLQNPLKRFKKGMMPQGRTIQEIFVDITESHRYDPEEAEQKVFSREIPDTQTIFHERNRQEFYKQTIQDESLKTAFISWGTFEDFLSRVISSIYNSAEVDEFKYMKLVIDNYYSKGLFYINQVADPLASPGNASEFVKQVRAIAKKMTLPMGSREYNAAGVHTRTDLSNLHLIIDADIEAQIDVDVLARAFNMDKTDFMGHVTVIDGFASKGLRAVLVDEDWFMVYDTLHKMETIRNPQGLYWNYIYHVWQVMSASRFGNAVAFVDDNADVPGVTQVIVAPVVASLRAGKEMSFSSKVRATDGLNHEVTWKIEGKDGTTVASGTSIDAKGKLVVAPSQTGRLIVKAETTYKDGETDKKVSGESIVSVY